MIYVDMVGVIVDFVGFLIVVEWDVFMLVFVFVVDFGDDGVVG